MFRQLSHQPLYYFTIDSYSLHDLTRKVHNVFQCGAVNYSHNSVDRRPKLLESRPLVIIFHNLILLDRSIDLFLLHFQDRAAITVRVIQNLKLFTFFFKVFRYI